MPNSENTPPRTFISYSWTSPDHEQWVLDLATRLRLIGAGNPYFDAEVQETRTSLDIPESGFTDVAGFVDWVSKRRSLHGHSTELPFSLTFDGQEIDGSENLTRFHYRDTVWPIQDHELPGPCCPTDPLFQKAETLTVRFGIDLAEEEPGFGDPTGAIVEFILLNRWRKIRSLRGNSVIYSIDEFTPQTGRKRRERYRHEPVGLGGTRGVGSQLPLWHQWWKLAEEGRTIPEIAEIAVGTSDGFRTYEERTVRSEIEQVREMMRPAENLRGP